MRTTFPCILLNVCDFWSRSQYIGICNYLFTINIDIDNNGYVVDPLTMYNDPFS